MSFQEVGICLPFPQEFAKSISHPHTLHTPFVVYTLAFRIVTLCDPPWGIQSVDGDNHHYHGPRVHL